ncbi:hypothetical protein F5B20DRAFT_248510 [Whalleya microplaca]|nr:hypothetical protein F5B20DRAFT_248510 [Whalleya microplaca]
MVGIPKSNRCTFCKSRKTKCDENWPTCGTCARAGKVCSGARSSFKFVVNGCHNNNNATPPISDSEDTTSNGFECSQFRSRNSSSSSLVSRRQGTGACTNRGAVMVDMKEYSAVLGGGTFRRMRLSRNHPSSYAQQKQVDRLTPTPTSTPTPSPSPSPGLSATATEQLATKLVRCLEAAAGTGHDPMIWGPSIGIIPQRLDGTSAVLQHAVELVLAAWMNSQRELPPEEWLDLRMYNRALRSLHGALLDPKRDLVTNTIAAQTLLQKAELTYDFGRGANQENHAAGITAVISRGGPWQGFTELDLHLTFDNYFNMLQEDVRQGRDSVFAHDEWATAFKQAIASSAIRPVLKATYGLWVEMTVWPTLSRLTWTLCQNPLDTMTAAELILRAMPAAEYLQNEEAAILSSLEAAGDIAEVENLLCPDIAPTCYRFSDFETAKLFTSHAMCGVIVCRALEQADLVLDHHLLCVPERARELSKRIWMSYPWMRTQRPLAIEFTAALAFSYESANAVEREFVTGALEDMEYFRRPPPVGSWIDATIMANVKGYTGRTPFIKTQDVNIELQGLGCRS